MGGHGLEVLAQYGVLRTGEGSGHSLAGQEVGPDSQTVRRLPDDLVAAPGELT